MATERDAGTAGSRFVLRPNHSLSWRATKWFLAGTCFLYACIAAFFLAMGAWPILPFAGLELLAVGAGLYAAALRGKLCEVIRVHEDTVEVEQGSLGRLRAQHRFPRGWARVHLHRERRGWYPSRLLVGAHGRAVEVGSFLNEDERRRLAQELRDAVGPSSLWAR